MQFFFYKLFLYTWSLQTLDAVKVEETPEISANASLSTNGILPPCDRNATNKEDVYSVSHIIPVDLMEELETDAKAIAKMIRANTPLSTDE